MRSPTPMGPWLYFPLYSRRTNRNRTSQLLSRHCPPRHILCSCPLPLRSFNGSSVCHYGRLCSLIPPIHRVHPPQHLIKNSICNYIHGSKSYLLPPTLPWTRRDTSPILRLSRCIHPMKHHFFPGLHSFPCRSNSSPIYHLRSLCCQTRSTRSTFYNY